MVKLIISGKFRIIIILTIILTSYLIAAQPLPMHSALGFSRTHLKAMQIIQDTEWSKQISKTKIELDTLMIQQLKDSNNKMIKTNLSQQEHPVLKLLKMNFTNDLPIKKSLLYCSLDDNTNMGMRARPGFHLPTRQPIEIQHAVTREELPDSKFFVLDLKRQHTLLISNTREISDLPQWLNEWNHLNFRLNQENPGYDFQFRRFENGSILLGGNHTAATHKMYLFLSPAKNEIKYASADETIGENALYPFELLKSNLKIRFETKAEAEVSVKIVDIHQQPVRTIPFMPTNTSGEHLIHFWDGYDDNGQEVPNGIYFYKIFTNNKHELPTGLKLVVLR